MRALYVLAVVKFRKFCVSRHSQSGIDEAARIDAFVLGNRIDRDLHRSGRIGRPGIGRFVRRHAVTALMTEEEARIRRFVGQYEPVVLDRDIALSPVETAEQLHAGLLLRLDDLRPHGRLRRSGRLEDHVDLLLRIVGADMHGHALRGFVDGNRLAHRFAHRQAVLPRFELRRGTGLDLRAELHFVVTAGEGYRRGNGRRLELRHLVFLPARLLLRLDDLRPHGRLGHLGHLHDHGTLLDALTGVDMYADLLGRFGHLDRIADRIAQRHAILPCDEQRRSRTGLDLQPEQHVVIAAAGRNRRRNSRRLELGHLVIFQRTLLRRLDDLRPRLGLHPEGHLDRHAALFLAAVRRNRNRDFGRGLRDRHRVAHHVAERQAISPRFEGRARRARLRPDDEGQFIPPPFTGNRGRNRTRFELRDLIGLRFRLIVGLVVRTGGETAQRNATQKRR